MADPLFPAERAQFSAIIDDILAVSDLTTISAKTIRKGLQGRLEVDISSKKQAVQELIMQRFDIASNKAVEPAETNGYHSEEKSEKRAKQESTPPSSRAISSPPPDEDEPPKKKRKPTKSKELNDEQYAKMLQEQENRSSRATRGAAKGKPVKRTPKKKVKKEKSERKVKAEDDSELDEVGSDGEVIKEKKEKKGGFHKLYHLSAPLADLVGEPTLSRPQVVKKIWEYIKERDLQDPSDKRQILCDERMQLVFKQEKVHMFTMNKILGKQLYDVEEE